MIVLSFSGKAGAGKDTAANLLSASMIEDGLRVVRLSFAAKLKDVCAILFGWDRARLDNDLFYKEGGLGGWVPMNKPGSAPQGRHPSDNVVVETSQSDPWISKRLAMRNILGWSEDEIKKHCVDQNPLAEEPEWMELDTDPACSILGMTRRTIMQRFGTECMREGLDQDIWIKLIQIDINRGFYDQIDVGIISDARFGNELEFAKASGGMNIVLDRIDTNTTLTQQTQHESELEWVRYGQEHGWDLRISNNIPKGIEVLRNLLVQQVYTKMVQNKTIDGYSPEVVSAILQKLYPVGMVKAGLEGQPIRMKNLENFSSNVKDACASLYGWDRSRLDSDPFYAVGGCGGWVRKMNPGMRPVDEKVVRASIGNGLWPSILIANPCYEDLQQLEEAKKVAALGEWVELDSDPICLRSDLNRLGIMQKLEDVMEAYSRKLNPPGIDLYEGKHEETILSRLFKKSGINQ